MRNYEENKIRKDLKTYALALDKTFSLLKPEKSEQFDDKLQKLLKGKWRGKHTECETVYVKREDGSDLRLLVVRRKNHYHTDCSGFLWCHGGGYSFGLPEMETVIAEVMTQDDECVMVLPDYTKSYEKAYPGALEDCYLALLWMKEHAVQLDIRKDQLFVGGEGAGGGLACALTLLAREKKEVNIAFQMPLYPMLDCRTHKCEDETPVWNSEMNEAAWRMYRGDYEEDSAFFSPARNIDYSDLPPAFTIVGDLDLSVKETETYFDRLYREGVTIMMKKYTGCFRGFNILSSSKSAKHANDLIFRSFVYARSHFFAQQNEEAFMEMSELLAKIKEETGSPMSEEDLIAETVKMETEEAENLMEMITQIEEEAEEEGEEVSTPIDSLEAAEAVVASMREDRNTEFGDLSSIIEQNINERYSEETEKKDEFTRDDVIRLLEEKKEERLNAARFYPDEEKEDVLGNLQKIIEDDTTDTLQLIEDLVDLM